MQRHRRSAGLSQREVARRSGLSERAVRDLERGSTARPRRQSAQAMAEALGLSGGALSAFLSAAQQSVAAQKEPTAAPDGLVGRDVALRRLVELVTVGRHRIVTVTGSGGVGKSRLVVAVIAALRARAAWDVRAVDVSGLGEPGLVAEVVAEAFGCGGPSRLPAVDRIVAEVGKRRAVLVLDGFERVTEAAPDLAALAARCPGLSVLTTSRRALRVRGEHEVRLSPLRPDDAIALFLARTGCSDTTGVAAICDRLDGLPLAIELAAARLQLLTPAELLDRLDRPLAVLSGGARDLPDRHRSLRATIESSLAVVSAPALALFERLSPFVGGIAFDDLEAVAEASGHDPACLLDALADLVDLSLVRVTKDDAGSRYTLPDAMRELAAERLAHAPDRADVESVFAALYLGRLRHHDRQPVAGPDLDNVRAALSWAITHDPARLDPSTVDAMCRYYESTGRFAEGQAMLVRVGALVPVAYVWAGQVARRRSEPGEAADLAHRALSGLPADDHSARGAAHLILGTVASDREDHRAARTHTRAALAHARRGGDLRLTGRVLNNLGGMSLWTGDLRNADRLLRAALVAKRRAGGDPLDVGRTLYSLAETALESGRFDRAVAYAEESIALLRAWHPRMAATVGSGLLLALWRCDRVDTALAVARDVIALAGPPAEDPRTYGLVGLRYSVILHAAGDRGGAAEVLRQTLPPMLADIWRERDDAAAVLEAHALLLAPGDPATAARLLGGADGLRHGSRPASEATASVAVRAAAICRQALRSGFRPRRAEGAALHHEDLVVTLVSALDRLTPVP